MRVFLTGATGFIGTAVVSELQAAGHTVLGLARSDAGAEALTGAGAAVARGDLTDPASLATAAASCEGVIHTGFIHDFANFAQSMATDRAAILAMLDALAGSAKPFVFASGFAGLHQGSTITEAKDATLDHPMPRMVTETMALAASARGMPVSVVRLAPSVHGRGDHHGFIPMLIRIAREKGVAAYIGDGANRWPGVARLDAARLFRLALERAAPEARWHAVGDEGVSMRAIAETIGEHLGLPARGLTQEDAAAHFGWMAGFVGADMAASSAFTQATLGWRPESPGLLEDMREGGYFER